MVVEPVTVKLPVMEVVARVEIPETVKAEEEAFPKTVWPETVRAVAEAVVRLVWPFPQRIPETDMEVAEATPKIGVIKVGEVCWTVKPVPVVPLL
jgi:hypothetical protein